ncbi:hypothetical protein FO519_008824 [Halicephalobus sp. NKZ332]|nr:hypothetical protein FO519_008824 [Halicephalobus sp. NKZ332]
MKSIPPEFQNYVENVINSELTGDEAADRVWGTTPQRRHFAIITTSVAWYAVRVIISGHGIVYHEQFMTADGAQGFVNKKSRELTNGTHCIEILNMYFIVDPHNIHPQVDILKGTQKKVIKGVAEMSDLIPKCGDLLVFNNIGYCHWAVYIGDDKVIHVTGADDTGYSFESLINGLKDKVSKAVVKEEELDTFGTIIRFAHVDNSLDSQIPPFSSDEIVGRARSKIGSWYYDLERNNCEHFAKWCRYGEEVCQQLAYAYDTGDSTGAGLGSYTLGPARYHLPSVHGKTVDEEGRKEVEVGAQVAGAELGFVKANVGASGKFGVQHNDSGVGVTAETKFAEARAGPVSTQLGLGVSTGVHADENGVGAEILGTGFSVGNSGIGISFFGSKFKISW